MEGWANYWWGYNTYGWSMYPYTFGSNTLTPPTPTAWGAGVGPLGWGGWQYLSQRYMDIWIAHGNANLILKIMNSPTFRGLAKFPIKPCPALIASTQYFSKLTDFENCLHFSILKKSISQNNPIYNFHASKNPDRTQNPSNEYILSIRGPAAGAKP